MEQGDVHVDGLKTIASAVLFERHQPIAPKLKLWGAYRLWDHALVGVSNLAAN